MQRMRYTVYDTEAHKYLERATQVMGTDEHLHTEWTRRADRAQRFPGRKSAEAMVRKLGGYSQIVIKNSRGEIVG